MFIRDSRRSYRTYSYAELILITDLCAFRIPVGVIELMLMLRSLTYSEVPVGTTEITERVQVLRNLFLYRSTCKYYGTYTGLTKLGHVFQILYMSYRAYTYLTELILILRSIYWSYRTWTCISDLIHVLQSIYLSYGSYPCAKVSVGTISRN